MSFRTLIAHQNIWLDERLNTGRGSYHIGGHVEITGHIDHDAFKSALNGLLDRHSSLQLRASHIFTRKLPQFYISTDVSWSLGWRDFSGTSNPDLAAHEHMQAWFREPFPDDAPLFRWALIRLAPDRHLWFKAYHHLLVDGAAISLIVQETARAYTAIIEGREPETQDGEFGDLQLFAVAREVIKHSDGFRLHLPADVENFSELPVGYLLAEDLSDTRWVVEEQGARIIFPNPRVKNGLRAGILIVPAEAPHLA